MVVSNRQVHLGGDFRPALGGVPAFSSLDEPAAILTPSIPTLALASPSRDLFQLLSQPISRNDELRLHLLKCELQRVSIGRVMPSATKDFDEVTLPTQACLRLSNALLCQGKKLGYISRHRKHPSHRSFWVS